MKVEVIFVAGSLQYGLPKPYSTNAHLIFHLLKDTEYLCLIVIAHSELPNTIKNRILVSTIFSLPTDYLYNTHCNLGKTLAELEITTHANIPLFPIRIQTKRSFIAPRQAIAMNDATLLFFCQLAFLISEQVTHLFILSFSNPFLTLHFNFMRTSFMQFLLYHM